MTDDDKKLVKRLRDGDHLWMTDRQEIADRIEALSAEISKWHTVTRAHLDRIEALTAEKDKLGNLLLETADRNSREIVRLEVENERYREALEQIRCDCDQLAFAQWLADRALGGNDE